MRILRTERYTGSAHCTITQAHTHTHTNTQTQ